MNVDDAMDMFAAEGRKQMPQRDAEHEQITGSTDAQLRDRLSALRERYDPKNDGGCFPGGGYPMPQLRELHLIEAELAARSMDYDMDEEELHPPRYEADNHSALWNETDIEHSAKYGR